MLAFSLLFSVLAENNSSTSNPYDADVTGTVYDADTNKPIQNALVTMEYHEIIRKEYTDSFGQYTFNRVPECFCLKNMTASKDGYFTQEIWVAVSDKTVVDFYLNPIQNDPNPNPNEGCVIGWVTDAETNKPIEAAEMTITYHDFIQIDYTDSNGKYMFENVPICYCLKNVTATMKGYESQSQLIGVSDVTYLNFSLKSIEEPKDPEDPIDPIDPEDPEDPKEPKDPEDPKQHEGIITGIVIDNSTNFPLEEVLMTLDYHGIVQETFTNSEGEYSFSNVPSCNCTKGISAMKDGYEIQDIQLSVYKITFVNFSMKPIEDPKEPQDPKEPENPKDPEEPEDPTDPEDPNIGKDGKLTGVVIDDVTGSPIPGVLMTLTYHEVKQTQLTDEDGQFTFKGVPICFCLKELSALKDGYEGHRMLIPVDEITYVNITLTSTNTEQPDDLDDESKNKSIDIPSTSRGQKGPENEQAFNFLIMGLFGMFILIILAGIYFIKTQLKKKY
jgi:hypothetical protein